MGDKCGQMGPVDFWARFDVTLDIVCVQFHKPGQNQITCAIDCPRWHMTPFGDLSDDALLDCNSTSQNTIRQYQPGVGKAEVG